MNKNKKMKTKSLSRKMQCMPCEICNEVKNISSGRSILLHGKKILLLIIVLFITVIAFAQDPPPPPPGGDPTGDPPLGGGAPIGSGLFILLGLGAAYGGKKIYDLKKKKLLD